MKKLESPLISIAEKELEALLIRLESQSLQKEDYPILSKLILSFSYFQGRLHEKGVTVLKLRKLLFGNRSERLSSSQESSSKEENVGGSTEGSSLQDQIPHKKKRKGTKVSIEEYPVKKLIPVPHKTHKTGENCPENCGGTLYEYSKPQKILHFFANPIVETNRYELQRLRCNSCSQYYTASAPEELQQTSCSSRWPMEETTSTPSFCYDFTVRSILSLCRYGLGLPMYRMERFQKELGVPLSDSTQWKLCEGLANVVLPVYQELVKESSNATQVFQDDTGNRILKLLQENRQENYQGRKSIFTTGLIFKTQESFWIPLFVTSRKHAGENLKQILKNRSNPEAIQQICDALSSNYVKNTILQYCWSHARRKFFEIREFFEECEFVLKKIQILFDNDKKSKGMKAQERLVYHQKNSSELMDVIHNYCFDLIEEKKAEPNSSLGKACKYFLKHWEHLTTFLRVPGIAIENNLAERTLKIPIRHRRNSLFFKTTMGAFVGDILATIIQCCVMNGCSPYHYLNWIQENYHRVQHRPRSYLPWMMEKAKKEVSKVA